MQSTDHESHQTDLQQRRHGSRAFMREALTRIATALGDGYEVELPRNIMHEGTGYILMPDGKRLNVNYEKLNAGKGQFDVRGDLTVENISLRDHLPHGRHNPHINVTVTRPAVAIARDIRRRLIPEYETIVNDALQNWRDSEAKKRILASESTKYVEASCGMLRPSPHTSPSAYSAQFHIHSNRRDSRILYGDVVVYADHADFNRLSNVPAAQALQIVKLLAEADGRTPFTSMNIITKYAPARLAVYGFYNDNGGLPAALEMFTALLAAHYHPSLTSTTCVNGIYSLTLVELPSNELDTFRTQQLADEQSWGKPLSYFDFAKINPRVPVEITADDYAYMLGVLPPNHGRHCFAMGELYTHNTAGEPIYYWACKRERRYFCLLGTQQEAEQEFAPTLISGAHSSLIQQLIDREDIPSSPTAALERLLKICQTTSVVLPSITASVKQLGQLSPPIVWTKPLTACGPDNDPGMKLHGTVEIDGVSFHAEAFEVCYSTDGEQIGKQDEEETHLGEICNIVQGAADTIAIAGREYVLAIIPGQR